MTGAVDQAMRHYYRRRAGEYDEWYRRIGRYDRGPANAGWHAELAKLSAWVDALRADRVLEIACGTGWWTWRLARHGWAVGLDFAPEMLRATGHAVYAAGVPARLTRGDAYELPFADCAFDAAFFAFWLSHVFPERARNFIEEVRRVVRPGGEVWVCDSAWAAESGACDHGPLPPPHTGGVHLRKLNDGSTHQVYKQFFTTDSLAEYLSAWGAHPLTACSAKYFVWGRVRVGE